MPMLDTPPQYKPVQMPIGWVVPEALVVRKQSGANTVQVAKNVMESLEELNSQLPEGVKVTTVSDNSRFIKASIASVQFDMVLGGILVATQYR